MGAQTDPSLLWEYQLKRRRQWFSYQGNVGFFALIAPLALTIALFDLFQILKIFYLFYAGFFAVMVECILSATSAFSAIFYFAILYFGALAFSPVVQWIYRLSPKPEWYILSIPLLIFVNFTSLTLIPLIEQSEWRRIKSSMGFTDNQLKLLTEEKGIANPDAKKVYENIFKTKSETISEKIFAFLMRYANRGPRHQAATSSDEKTGPTLKPLPANTYSQPTNQLKLKWSSAYDNPDFAITTEAPQFKIQQNQSNGQMEELHELQIQAEEMLKKLKGIESSMSAPTVDPAKELAAFFQEAFNRNDLSALSSMAPEEMNVTMETEDALCKSISPVKTRLNIVKGGGSYLLIHQGEKDWLIPTFLTFGGFLASQPSKGIFSYARESVATVELRLPAEVKEVGSVWEVVSMGVVAVPA